MTSPLVENSQSTVKRAGGNGSQVLSRCAGSPVNSADYVAGHMKEASSQQSLFPCDRMCFSPRRGEICVSSLNLGRIVTTVKIMLCDFRS